MKRKLPLFILLALCLSLALGSCSLLGEAPSTDLPTPPPSFSLDSIPAFDGETPYVVINENNPFFDTEDTSSSYELYSELDSAGRCGTAISCIGIDLMPTEDRGSIGSVKPSGWQSVKYDIVDGKYLYNRCHLIGYQLTGENANTKNLITGTRYMNVIGMLPFENMVADYIKETENHVLFRVTPIFEGENLLASGVLMEARSVEDNGEGILFCVYVYNAQPGIVIDYSNGDSRLSTDPAPAPDESGDGNEAGEESPERTYILNISSEKFHYPNCRAVDSMSEHNKQEYRGTHEELVQEGYSPCGICRP